MTRNNNQLKILILWANPESGNYGVRVLAEGLSIIAKNLWGRETQIDFGDFTPTGEIPSLGPRAVAIDFLNPNGQVKKLIKKYDLIIDSGGGDSFTDIYGLKRLLNIAYIQKLGTRHKTPIVLGPQTIGPFESGVGKKIAKNLLSSASLVFTRDSTSSACASEIGITPNATSTDVVFALPVPQATETSDVLVNISGLLWDENGLVDYVQYRSDTKTLINELINVGRVVTLIPHVLNDFDPKDNDLKVINNIKSEFGNSIKSYIPESLWDVRKFISGSNLLIGARMHACLNALSVGVPAIPWAYSRKFLPLMEEIGWNYGIDLRTSTNPVAETMKQIETISNRDFNQQITLLQENARSKLSIVPRVLIENLSLGDN